MKLDRKNILKILGIVTASLAIAWVMEHYQMIGQGIGTVLHILWPLMFGIIIAFVLNIPMRFFERHILTKTKKKGLQLLRRPLCILLAILCILGILVLVFSLVVPQLIDAVSLLIKEVPPFVNSVLEKAFEKEDIYVQFENWVSTLEINWEETAKKAITMITQGAGSLLGSTISVIAAIAGSIFNFVMALIFALYMLLGKETLKSQLKRSCDAFLPEKFVLRLHHVMRVTCTTFEKFVSGQCVEAVILGTLCLVGMLLLRLPYATMIGALVGFTALVPIVGAWLGAIVGAFMIGMQSPSQAVVFIIFLLLLQQVEGNLIYPRVVGSSVGLPPLWVLTAITLGGSINGIVGMLLAVPVFSVLYTLSRELVHARLTQKQPPKTAPAEETPEKTDR